MKSIAVRGFTQDGKEEPMIVGRMQGWRLLLPVLFAASHILQAAAQAPNASDREETLPAPKPLLPVERPADDRLPIDLATTLRLAGANNLQIAVASERVRQAQARLEGAKVLWLPSLNLGAGYNRHEGQIQDTRGDVIDAHRSSAFVGGGAKVGSAPLTGGSNGPAPFFVSLSLADAIFAPLAERQLVKASDAARAATFNDTLLEVALGYLELVRAQARSAIAQEAVKNAQELVRLIEARVKAGTAPPADDLRARAELAERQRQVFQAEEAVYDVSAELVRLLRLEPATILAPLERQPMPINLVPPDQPLPDLLAQGLANRPELAEHQALVNATLARLKQEKWRPFIPNVQVGYGSGGFGGGRDSFFGDFDGRGDFDAIMVWEVRNLGFGNRALQRERASQHQQASLTAEQIRDLVIAEVTRNYHRARLRHQQIDSTRTQVEATAEALPLNFKGILGGQLRAIEAQQAIQGLAFARNQYLDALTEFNRAQFQLLRALGQPPALPCAASAEQHP